MHLFGLTFFLEILLSQNKLFIPSNFYGDASFLVCFCFVFVTTEGFTTVVANKGLEKARAYLNQVPQGLTALHPLQRMQCKHQVETPLDYTYSLF